MTKVMAVDPKDLPQDLKIPPEKCPLNLTSDMVKKEFESRGFKLKRTTNDKSQSAYRVLFVEGTVDLRIVVTYSKECKRLEERKPMLELTVYDFSGSGDQYKLLKSGGYNYDLIAQKINVMLLKDAPALKFMESLNRVKEYNQTKFEALNKSLKQDWSTKSCYIPEVKSSNVFKDYGKMDLGHFGMKFSNDSDFVLVNASQAARINTLMKKIHEENRDILKQYKEKQNRLDTEMRAINKNGCVNYYREIE